MLAITCDKCRRRFTPTTEELQGHLAQSEGKKYGLVLCPHCGKGNKIAHERMIAALRFSLTAAPVAKPAAEGQASVEG